jgi:hypothetical protein
MATKQEILSKLAASHEQRISKVLFDLEEDIINSLQEATNGIPLTTDLAIQLRPNLKRLIEQNYLKEGSKIISEYDEVVKGYMDYIRTTPVPDRFKLLTQPDLKLINQLKQLSFSGFENVANRFLDTIANEVYQSAIVGKPFPEMVQNIRGAVNGVYRRSNEAAINRLVDIVEENRYSDDPISKKKFEDARKILHSKYASDIRGENMRKYASQIAHDSIMQFDGQFTKYKGEEAGITSFKYTGTNIITTREFCRTYLNEVRTEEEWRDIFTGNWKGKSGSDPFINRGGYRCRHSFVPYDPAWDAEDVQKEIKKEEIKIDRKRKKENIFGDVSNDEKDILPNVFGKDENKYTKAISLIPALKQLRYVSEGKSAYYFPWNNADQLNVKKVVNDGAKTTFAHEYGHRIDDQIGRLVNDNDKVINELSKNVKDKNIVNTFKKGIVYKNEAKNISILASEKILEDRKILVKALDERKKQANDWYFSTISKLSNNIDKRYKQCAKILDELIDKDFPLTKNEFLKIMGKSANSNILVDDIKTAYQIKLKLMPSSLHRYMHDYIGSVTRNKVGFGHSDSYYKKWETIFKDGKDVVKFGENLETFANYYAAHTGNFYEFGKSVSVEYVKLMNYYAPNLTREYEYYMDVISKL